MSPCTTQGECWNQEANQEYPTKKYPLKNVCERGRKLLANRWEGIQKKGFNTSSSNHDHTETAIEAQRPRIEEGQCEPCWLKFWLKEWQVSIFEMESRLTFVLSGIALCMAPSGLMKALSIRAVDLALQRQYEKDVEVVRMASQERVQQRPHREHISGRICEQRGYRSDQDLEQGPNLTAHQEQILGQCSTALC